MDSQASVLYIYIAVIFPCFLTSKHFVKRLRLVVGQLEVRRLISSVFVCDQVFDADVLVSIDLYVLRC